MIMYTQNKNYMPRSPFLISPQNHPNALRSLDLSLRNVEKLCFSDQGRRSRL